MSIARKVLYVGNHAGYFLTHRLPVFQALQDMGYDVHVAVPATIDTLGRLIDDDPVGTINHLGFQFHNIPMCRGSEGLRGEIRLIYRLLELYRSLKPELVYHSTLKPVLYGGLASRFVGVPGVVFGITGLGHLFMTLDLKGRLIRTVLKFLLKIILAHKNSYTIFQNGDDYRLFVDQRIVKAERAIIIKGSGVDLDKFSFVEEPIGIPVVVLISRMLWDKGVGEFFEAATILKEAGVQGRFVLVGDSDPANPASVPRSQLQTWHDSGIVEWWGWCKDTATVFQQSHVASLPSYREGVPKSLIEAAACGRPIVTTDVPGCREIVQNEINGLLVPPKDAQALARALRRLIENPFLRQEMGKRSHQLAESDFAVEKVVSKTLRICNKLLSTSSGEGSKQ
jgi:glycosyltransferase involved in cell wall biosynthesis